MQTSKNLIEKIIKEYGSDRDISLKANLELLVALAQREQLILDFAPLLNPTKLADTPYGDRVPEENKGSEIL